MSQNRRNFRDGTFQEHSAGGVVLRASASLTEVLLIATRRGDRWGLPKGALDEGETAEDAAIREVREETGVEGEIVDSVGTIEYFFRARGQLVRKRVDFFLMRSIGGKVTPQLSEVDDARFFPADEALERASFPSERELIEKALSAWPGGAAPS